MGKVISLQPTAKGLNGIADARWFEQLVPLHYAFDAESDSACLQLIAQHGGCAVYPAIREADDEAASLLVKVRDAIRINQRILEGVAIDSSRFAACADLIQMLENGHSEMPASR